METYDIHISPVAYRDIDEIIENLNTLSPAVAMRYNDLLIDGIDSLAEFPNRCPPAHEPGLAARGYRFLVVRNYLVFYTVEGTTVTVHRILDGRRDLTEEWQ